MQSTGAEVRRFGAFELDVQLRELRNGSARVRLQEQPFEILRLLLEHPGEVVTREQLRDRLWPNGTFVDFEHSLNAAVKRLRAALGDEADNPRFIETLPRRGYRFIARLQAPPDPAPAIAAAPLRLAVLPFTNLSEDPAQEYFSDGLTEEMIAQLGARCRGRVGILARWSSMAFKGTSCRAREIGEALEVAYLLEGSVRRDGERVRITARLVETAGETHLWSETYERSLTDCLLVQADVAAHIAQALAMELLPDERCARATACDPAAFQAYLKARYAWNKPFAEGLDDAIAFYHQAIEAAPAFGAARASLARAWVAQAEYYRELPRQALVRARAEAARALEIDSGLDEACLADADTRRLLDYAWDAADAAYRQALALNPSSEAAHRMHAVALTARGRSLEAIRAAERARDLDPLCLVVGATAAWVRYMARDYEGAIQRCHETIDMDPEHLPARRLLGAALLQAGLETEAVAELESVAMLGDGDPVPLAWLAHAQAVTGRRADAERLVQRIRALHGERYVSPFHLALAHVGLGDLDAAFAALDQAWLDRDPAVTTVMVEPRLDPIRQDARYAALLERVHLDG